MTGPARSAVAVVTGRCQGCGACLLTCPERAIRPGPALLTVLAERCTGCGECVEVCPVDAIGLPGGTGPGNWWDTEERWEW